MQKAPEYGTKGWFKREYDFANNKYDPWGSSIRAGLQIRMDKYIQFIQNWLETLGFENGGKSLDVGCALGDFSARLAYHYFYQLNLGGDITLKALLNAKQRFDFLQYCAMALPHLPVPDKTFNFVSCISVLYYPQEEERILFLQEMNRVLKPGGYIFLEVPIGNAPFFSPDQFFELSASMFEIVDSGLFYGKFFLKLEGVWFQLARKADRKSQQRSAYRNLWRSLANVLEKILQAHSWAKSNIWLSTKLKIGASHAYVLSRRKYES